MKKSFVILALPLMFAGVGMAKAYAGETIDQKDKQFSQSAITVKAGDTVTFTNSDTVTHDLSVKNPDGSKLMSQSEKPGDSVPVTFSKPGDYNVRCLIHPKMKMIVTVQ